MLVRLTNGSQAPQGVYGMRGPVFIKPGRSRVVRMNGQQLKKMVLLGILDIDVIEDDEVDSPTPAEPIPVHETRADIETLRAEYLELTGKAADKRWKEARVRAEIDKALAG